MNRKIIAVIAGILIVVLIILIIVLIGKINSRKNAEMPQITDYANIVVNYVENNSNMNIESFKTFTEVSVLDTKKDKEDPSIEILLTWIDSESFFVNQDNLVEFYSGYEDIYEIKIKNSEVISFNKKDIKDISRENKKEILKIKEEGTLKNNLLTQVENYYSINRSQIYY